MYDFYFGTEHEINKDPKKYLLTIKRMIPRWCNSIPDSEFLALYDAMDAFDFPAKPVFIETGSGASTIVLAYFAIKTGGELFTWDINGSKLFYLRSILNDTVMRHFTTKNLANHWKYIAYSSTADFGGISMLEELLKEVSVCFFDSEHASQVLMRELELAVKVLADIAVVMIDDANYKYTYQNTAYVNMIRMKIGLPAVSDKLDNIGQPFWKLVGKYLEGKFKKVEYLKDTYKKNYQNDLFWSYFRNDRDTMSKLNMEKTEDLEHRFDSWKVQR